MNRPNLTNRYLRQLASVLALLLVVSPFTAARFATPDISSVSTATREGRLAVFDDVWSTIYRRYYDSNFNGQDWEAQRTFFRARAVETTSAEELYAVLRKMIATLDDPHTRVYRPDEKSEWWRPRFVTVGLGIRDIDGLPTVAHVEKRSDPDRAGVRSGDVILTVDGKSALKLLKERLSWRSSASTRGRVFASLFEGASGSTVHVTWQRKDGSQKAGRFRRYWHQREFGVSLEREDNIAIITIDAFTPSLAKTFAGLMQQKIKGVNGIVLDLRNNAGGDAQAMADIASSFLGPGVDLGEFTDRSGSQITIVTRSRSPITPKPIVQTRVPLVVLASERTASAAEIFIAALKQTRRANIVGSETCGCVLAIRNRHTLPDGGLLDVSELDYQTPSGERLEKNGVDPDQTITIERADLYANHDRALDFAVSQLSQRSRVAVANVSSR